MPNEIFNKKEGIMLPEPTTEQVKLWNEIEKHRNEKNIKIETKFQAISNELKVHLTSTETANKIHQVGEKNNLNENQLWWASHTAGMIILGETNIVNFVKTLQEKCKLTEEPARQLARDINQAIFLPVKENLKKIHKVPQWPREDETKEPSVSPKIEGNVVNLKE